MDISTIQEFCELARSGSFSGAASHLSITQPLLTRHIQKLEQELGYSLLDRTTRQVSLNEAGALFLPYAQQILDAYQNYIRASHCKTDSGTLRIGVAENFSRSSVQDRLFQFLSSQKIAPEMTMGDLVSLKEQLRLNRLDLIIAYEKHEIKDDGLSRITYFRDELAVVLPTGHPLAREKNIPLSSLSNERFILMRPDTLVGKLSVDCCKEAGFDPDILHISKFEDNILEMVRKQAGISILFKLPRNVIGATVIEMEPTMQVDLNLIFQAGNSTLKDLTDFMLSNRPFKER